MPTVGQGYSYWAIDRLGFDQEFLGLLAQVSSILSLVGLMVFRKPIVERPVSFTLFWVVIAGTILYLPTIGLFYGVNEWSPGMSPGRSRSSTRQSQLHWRNSQWCPCWS